MDWNDIINIIVAIVVAVGLPLALRRRAKQGPEKAEELRSHLAEMGIEVYPKEKGVDTAKRSWAEKAVGILEVKHHNIGWITVVGVANQYQTSYFIDYVVETPLLSGKGKTRKVVMRKKKAFPRGKVEWHGDKPLAQNLNLDYSLEDRLLSDNFKGGIEVALEPNKGYGRIRTSYFLPSSEIFEAVDIIARHLRGEASAPVLPG